MSVSIMVLPSKVFVSNSVVVRVPIRGGGVGSASGVYPKYASAKELTSGKPADGVAQAAFPFRVTGGTVMTLTVV